MKFITTDAIKQLTQADLIGLEYRLTHANNLKQKKLVVADYLGPSFSTARVMQLIRTNNKLRGKRKIRYVAG